MINLTNEQVREAGAINIVIVLLNHDLELRPVYA